MQRHTVALLSNAIASANGNYCRSEQLHTVSLALSAKQACQVCLYCQARTESRSSFSSVQTLFSFKLENKSCRPAEEVISITSKFKSPHRFSLCKVYCAALCYCCCVISWGETTRAWMVLHCGHSKLCAGCILWIWIWTWRGSQSDKLSLNKRTQCLNLSECPRTMR